MFLPYPNDLIIPACYAFEFGPNARGYAIFISVTVLLSFFFLKRSGTFLLLQFQVFITVLKTDIGGFGYLQICPVHIYCI